VELGYSVPERLSVDLHESPIMLFSDATSRSGLARHSMDHSESVIVFLSNAFRDSDLMKHSVDHSESENVLLSDAFPLSSLARHSMDHSESGKLLLSDAIPHSSLTRYSMDHSESVIVLLSDAFGRSDLTKHSLDHSESVIVFLSDAFSHSSLTKCSMDHSESVIVLLSDVFHPSDLTRHSGEFTDSGSADVSMDWTLTRFHGSGDLIVRAMLSEKLCESAVLWFSEEFPRSDPAANSRACLSGGSAASIALVGSCPPMISFCIPASGPFFSLVHTISSGSFDITAAFGLSNGHSTTAPPTHLLSPSAHSAYSVSTSKASTWAILGSLTGSLLAATGAIVFRNRCRRAACAGDSESELEDPDNEIPSDTVITHDTTFESGRALRRLTQANMFE
jgi:hypothetical protein